MAPVPVSDLSSQSHCSSCSPGHWVIFMFLSGCWCLGCSSCLSQALIPYLFFRRDGRVLLRCLVNFRMEYVGCIKLICGTWNTAPFCEDCWQELRFFTYTRVAFFSMPSSSGNPLYLIFYILKWCESWTVLTVTSMCCNVKAPSMTKYSLFALVLSHAGHLTQFFRYSKQGRFAPG